MKNLKIYNSKLASHWLERRPSSSSCKAVLGEDFQKWISEKIVFEKREPIKKDVSKNYGPYPKEFINTSKRRRLYTSISAKGDSNEYNVFISAPLLHTDKLAILMQFTFLNPKKVGYFLKNGCEATDEDELNNKNNLTHIKINGFKIDDDDITTVGILFTYKERI